MKNKGTHDYFSVLVIGENPDDIISEFDEMNDSDKPYILYSYSDKNKLRKTKIEIYKELLKTITDSATRNITVDKIKELKNTTDDVYYASLGELDQFDEDNNIITRENPNSEWLTCDLGGRIYNDKLKTVDGSPISSVIKKDVGWNLIHMPKDSVSLYENTWDLCNDIKKPETPGDINIIKNMSVYKDYFTQFKDSDKY